MAEPAVHVVAVMPPPMNGMTYVTSQIVASFRDAGHVKLYAVSSEAGETGLYWSVVKHFRMLRALTRAVRSSSPGDICYLVPDSGNGLWGNLVQAVIVRTRFHRVLLHHHVFSYINNHDRRFAMLLRILGKSADHIVLCGHMGDKITQLYCTGGVVHKLGNSAFVTPPQCVRVRSQLRTIGFLSNVTYDKGVQLFMETTRSLASAGYPVKAIIAGPVGDKRLADEIKVFVKEDPDRRSALGAVSGKKKDRFFDLIDVLLFPSLYRNEAQPITIYEALSVQLPVLATRRGCIPDQITTGKWAFESERFVSAATDQIKTWIQSPATYMSALEMAGRIWSRQSSEDRAALIRLTGHIFEKLHSPLVKDESCL